MDWIKFLFHLLLPWVLGYQISRAVLGSEITSRGVLLGVGYIVGWYLVYVILIIYDFAKFPFNISELSLILFALTISIWVFRLKNISFCFKIHFRLPKWTFSIFEILTVFIFLLIFFKLCLIFIDLTLKPVFPWDGWVSWSAKAKIFSYHKEMPPLYDSPVPFWKVPDDYVFVYGKRHPNFIPLVQTYTALAWGSWEDNLVNIPWFGLAIAELCLIFGIVKNFCKNNLVALVSCYILLSLPIFDTHITLGSYADVWVGFVFLIVLYFTILTLVSFNFRLFLMLLLHLIILYNVKHTSIVFIPVLFGIISVRFVGFTKSLILIFSVMVCVYFFREVINDHILVYLTQILGSSVAELKYNAIWQKVWLQWIILDNWHFIFITTLFSFAISIYNTKRKRLVFFELIAAAVIFSLLIMMLVTVFTGKFSSEEFIGYFNRVTLHFVSIFAILPISAYYLCQNHNNGRKD